MVQRVIGVVCVASFVSVGAGCRDSEPSSTTADASTETEVSAAAAPAHCGINPAIPERDAAAPGSCLAARYLLACSAGGGGSVTCLSDDPNRCDDSRITTSACTSGCNANEYAAECGGLSPSVDGGGKALAENAPKSCRNVGIAPGGEAFYCCPCQ